MARKHTQLHQLFFPSNALLVITRCGSIFSVFVSWRDVALERARNKLAMQEFRKVLAANLVSTFVAARTASWRRLSYWVTGSLTDLMSVCRSDCLTDWRTNRPTTVCRCDWLYDWLAYWLSVFLMVSLTGWPTDWPTNWLSMSLSVWLSVCLTVCLTDCLLGWVTDGQMTLNICLSDWFA